MQTNTTEFDKVNETAELKPLRRAIGVIDTERVLARIVKIDDVIKHPNADALDIAIIGGWQCVTKLGEYSKGDIAVYCEIDSLLPIDLPYFAFLAARRSDNFMVNGKEHHRLKSVKLRKEISQGLLIKVPEILKEKPIDTDVTADLSILKFDDSKTSASEDTIKSMSLFDRIIYELTKDMPTHLSPWPSALSKSSQDRAQNKMNQITAAIEAGEAFERSSKLDGASMTVFILPGQETRVGVCSRNNELALQDIPVSLKTSLKYWLSTLLSRNRRLFKTWSFKMPIWRTKVGGGEDEYTRYALKHKVIDKLIAYQEKTGEYITVQGELIGPGIQDNSEGVDEHEFYVYSVYRNGNVELLPDEAKAIVAKLGLSYVPVQDESFVIPKGWGIKDLLKLADGPRSFNQKKGTYREGDVYKSKTRFFSFKVISDNYLLKKKD